MCTVTFLPLKDRVLFASNRDEKKSRSDATEPRIYGEGQGPLLYPRDPDAGGTWIALHGNGNAVIFLNGGFRAHVSQPPYRRSRGLVLLDLMDSPSPSSAFSSMLLEGIEPFTAVIWESGKLLECVWDGETRHMNEKDASVPHIWSSSTLYNDLVRSKRKHWYDEWTRSRPSPAIHDLIHFHRFTGDGDPHNDLLMNRDGHMFTVSITGLELRKDMGTMTYLDLKNNREHLAELPISKS